MALAKTLMVQGTSSSVGKSLLVTALCRIFRQAGVSVAPFKAQNMSLNAAVTRDGLEMGRAQAVQAEAAGVNARVEMNPILLKPEGDQRSQLIVMGRPAGHVTAASYYSEDRQALKDVIAQSLETLRREHELVILEGAGSPAEVNLKHRDLVNMHVARLADAPVLLVGDIDRGGVFASLLGTLDLLDEDERARVAALIVNKFCGDVSLFDAGIEFLEARSGKPVLGVVPFVPRLAIADEDSQSLDQRSADKSDDPNTLHVAVIRLPRMSNHDDVLSLEHEPGVSVRFVERAQETAGCDLVIVPGSKHTVSDLAWLREHGFDRVLRARAEQGEAVLGICGGCQMLGEAIEDPHGVESLQPRVVGLGLLPLTTRFERYKTTAQVRVQRREQAPNNLLTADLATDVELLAYEIHHGTVTLLEPELGLFAVQRVDVSVMDGATNAGGNVIGTLLHGLLDNVAVRSSLLGRLRARRGLVAPVTVATPTHTQEYDRLAAVVARALDMDALRTIVGPLPERHAQER